MKTARFVLVLALLGLWPAAQGVHAEAGCDLAHITSVTVTPDIEYANRDGLGLLLDLYEPAGPAAEARPAIVFAHGGGFREGSKCDEGIVQMAVAFADMGYVTVSIDYRVDPDLGYEELIVGSLAGQMPEAMRNAQLDMQAAVRWVRANAEDLSVAPSKISAGGISAGASMALEAAYNPEDDEDPGDSSVAAAVSESGATDPRRIEMGAPPVAMFNGTHDTTAPYPTAIMACGAATVLQNVCELTTYLGAEHSLADHRSEIIALSADFLCRHGVGICLVSPS
jgi:acetyl esterase/lipase